MGIVFFHTDFNNLGNINLWLNGSLNCVENLDTQNHSIYKTLVNGYEKFGVAFFEKLEYNFALVIEDGDNIIAVRDRFGIEPLYYIKKEETFYFSQNIKDLTKISDSINDKKKYAYLSHYSSENSDVYDSSTFYNDIKSVLPGHYLIITFDGVNSVPYWKPTTVTYKKSEMFDSFGELLIHSLKKNTASFTKVVAQVSGGLDSSSLALLYSKLGGSPTTMNIDPEIPESKDGYYLVKVLKTIKTGHYTLPPDKDIYSTISEISKYSGLPDQVILSSSFVSPISRKAAELSCDAIISGHDGDTIIGHGYGYLDILKRNGDWYTFSKMLSEIALNIETSHTYSNWREIDIEQRTKVIKEKYFGTEILKLLKSREITKIKKLLADSKKEFGYTPINFIQFLAKKVYHKLIYPKISSNLLLTHYSQGSSDESLDELYSLNKYTASEQFRSATSQTFINVNEQLFATGQYYGHKYLFPFMERRLLEFSMNVPDEVKFGNGKTRALLRNALKEVLPPELLERRGKTDFTKYAIQSCLNLWQDNKDKFMANVEIWNIVDQKKFIKGMQLVANPKVPLRLKSSAVRNLNRVMYLSIWLDTLK